MSNPSSPTWSITGGARIGFVNFSWPLAKLNATADRLTITTTMFGLFSMGSYSFADDEVVSIEPYGSLPFVGQGIRITHTVANHPPKIIFWGNPQTVMTGVASTGFVARGSQGSPALPQERAATGFPLRWQPLAVLVAIWNGLFLLGLRERAGSPFGFIPFILAAGGLIFCTALAALLSPAVRKVFMRPGRDFGEVRNAFLLTAFVTGLMTAVFGTLALGPARAAGPSPAMPGK